MEVDNDCLPVAEALTQLRCSQPELELAALRAAIVISSGVPMGSLGLLRSTVLRLRGAPQEPWVRAVNLRRVPLRVFALGRARLLPLLMELGVVVGSDGTIGVDDVAKVEYAIERLGRVAAGQR